MPPPPQPMRSALRDWQQLWPRLAGVAGAAFWPLAIWALATAAGTLAGPFGTFEALGWGPRALYWGGVAAVAIVLSLALHALHRGPLGRTGTAGGLALDVAYALVLGAGVHALNSRLFAGWGGWGDYLWLVGVILAMALGIEALRWLFNGTDRPADDPGGTEATEPAQGSAALMRRLPLERRGALLRIEAQDHYLRVVTDRGAEMLLMRMADAEAMLGAEGLRVHRSHWVALAAVEALRRDGGRWRLVMADGAEVPVSRGYRSQVAAAGLTPAG